MNLHSYIAANIVRELSGNIESIVLGGFDPDGADTTPHARQALYALGYVTFREFPGNPYFGGTQLWDMGMELVDNICDRQGEDGNWQWRAPASGAMWRTRYVWSVYAWMRAIEEFGEHFGKERLARFREVIARSVTSRVDSWQRFLESGERRTSLNIFAWEGLETWLAGRAFDREDFLAAGAEQVNYCIRRQKPDGWWPDAQRPRGAVVAYNSVTASAVSAYARLSGDAAARDSVRRAAQFHLDFRYPDKALVETIDERNRYGRRNVSQSRAGNMQLVCAFAPFEESRAAAACFAGELDEGDKAGPAEARTSIAASTFADVLDSVPPGDVAPAEIATPVSVYDIPALVRRRDPWFYCLSGSATEVRGSLFHLDLQNHISVWHRDHGLIVGGGNSLWDPSFSTVRLGGRYLATGGEVCADDAADALTLRYGATLVHVRTRILNDRAIRFEVRTAGEAPENSQFAVTLPHVLGRSFALWDRPEVTLGEKTEYMDWPIEPGRLLSVRVGPVTVTADVPGIVTWPHRPISIYNVPDRLPLEEAVLRVGIPLCAEPRLMTLTVA